MKAKERTAIPRVEMNELDAKYRSHSRKEEVNQGLTAEQAITESKRCLDCANPGCMEGCPVGIDITPVLSRTSSVENFWKQQRH